MPTCQVCGLGLRWIPESNAWGCDRCRQLYPVAAQPPQPRAYEHPVYVQAAPPPKARSKTGLIVVIVLLVAGGATTAALLANRDPSSAASSIDKPIAAPPPRIVGADCKSMAAHALGFEKSQLAQSHMDLGKVIEAMARHCEKDAWSRAAIDCYANVTATADITACSRTLTPAQLAVANDTADAPADTTADPDCVSFLKVVERAMACTKLGPDVHAAYKQILDTFPAKSRNPAMREGIVHMCKTTEDPLAKMLVGTGC